MKAHIFHFHGRPKTTNAQRFTHWSQQAGDTRGWRGNAFYYAKQKEPLAPPVEIHVQPVTKDNRRADAGACAPTVKAIIDGFVDAGLIPDDGPDIVKAITYHAPERDKDLGDRLIIEVAEQRVLQPVGQHQHEDHE